MGETKKGHREVPRCQGFNGPRKYEPDIWKRENILIPVLSGAGASRSESPFYANRRRRPSGRGTLQHGPPPRFGVTLTRDSIHVHRGLPWATSTGCRTLPQDRHRGFRKAVP